MMPTANSGNDSEMRQTATAIKNKALQLGFSRVGITGIDLSGEEPRFLQWLRQGMHGSMDYMQKHGLRRLRPAELVPGTVRVISVSMNYLRQPPAAAAKVLGSSSLGYISRYALGRDYHRVLRSRLRHLATELRQLGGGSSRVFCDSAPVLEKALAQRAGLGWVGKHTLLLHPEAGSWFFLGEIYTDMPLPVDPQFSGDPCGSCVSCITACPTGAIVAPRKLDARRCISYLTIEHRGSIPVQLRPAIGNRIYGCDDCQLACPWNKYARCSVEPDFQVRHGLDASSLLNLFAWEREEFLQRTEGMALRRAGYQGWLRNIAVALGNAPTSPGVVAALRQRASDPSELVREHVHWALQQHGAG